ncbi:hypothetical protein [Streptomyces sp. Inha503]|uniref:hypothetical protein n=1 Tax=Streptomyces sp. Inha503 TaxID=3383314 RepID=UPI0039A1CCB9
MGTEEAGAGASAPDDLEQVLTEHAGSLDAVRHRDASAARDRMIAHQSRTRDLRLGALARSARGTS